MPGHDFNAFFVPSLFFVRQYLRYKLLVSRETLLLRYLLIRDYFRLFLIQSHLLAAVIV